MACPLALIRGKRSARLQQESIEEQRRKLQIEIQALKTRVNEIRKKICFPTFYFSIHVMCQCPNEKNVD